MFPDIALASESRMGVGSALARDHRQTAGGPSSCGGTARISPERLTPVHLRPCGALRRLPAIGEPAADRILLQAGLHAVPTLDSNGLRVLVWLGLAQDAPSYAVSHRSATAVLRDTPPAERAPLLRAYLLPRTHGRELCRRTAPACAACPLADRCEYAKKSGHRAPSR